MSEPDGLVEAVASGDRKRALVALRDHLAVTLTNAEPRETAALARQLADVLAALAEMPEPKGSVVDEFTARSARRREAAGL